MSDKIKASRYNHFVPLENGNRLAFNALTCGLAEMDPNSYQRYCDLIARGEINGDTADDLQVNLRKGGFITPSDIDELDAIRAAHYQARFGNRGLGLTIIPTYACNFACDYCYQNRNIHQQSQVAGAIMTSEIADNIVKYVSRQVTDFPGLSVTWYGGEPLMAFERIESLTNRLIQLCESKSTEYRAGLITNGYLLTPDKVHRLSDLQIQFVQITLDGPSGV